MLPAASTVPRGLALEDFSLAAEAHRAGVPQHIADELWKRVGCCGRAPPRTHKDYMQYVVEGTREDTMGDDFWDDPDNLKGFPRALHACDRDRGAQPVRCASK